MRRNGRRGLTEEDDPRPTDAYGKSKLAAERGLAQLELDWVSLRAALVYGPGVKGNMAKLMRLARSPYPLPLRSISARRSLLALENLLQAVDVVLKTPAALRRPLIVADIEALTAGDMVAAMRRGLGRTPAIFATPPMVLHLLLRSIGKESLYQRLCGSLVANPSGLVALGWKPALTTPFGLQRLMYAPHAHSFA